MQRVASDKMRSIVDLRAMSRLLVLAKKNSGSDLNIHS